MTNERKQSALSLSKAHLSNILKLQAAFLYLIYHQRSGKTSLFLMRGVDFTHFNTSCTLKQSGLNQCVNIGWQPGEALRKSIA